MAAQKEIHVFRTKKSAFDKYVRYPAELAGVVILCGFLRILPLDWASALGGFIGRHIGPRMRVSWVARYNLMKAFPEKTPVEIDAIVVRMWDNLGRTFAEYPHLRFLSTHYEKRVEFMRPELFRQLRDDGMPGIFFSAHIGNWEVSSISANMLGIPFHRIYRFSNNPLVEWLFRYYRQKIPGELLPKGTSGMRRVVELMNREGHLALLVDQKMNDGIEAPFFGYPAMTTPALARLALKYGCPVLPVRSRRSGGAHFQLLPDDLLTFRKTGNIAEDTRRFTAETNRILERWIRDDPAQWLWVHKRWPDSNMGSIRLYADRHLWKKGIKPPELFAEAISGRRNEEA
ncbi:MAG: lysophospholipid acyltransferase family protein [Alphaproteobacteria bacterium]